MTRTTLLLTLMLGVLVCSGPLASAATARGPVDFSAHAKVEFTDNRDSAGEMPDGVSQDEESTLIIVVKPRVDLFFDFEVTVFDFYLAPSVRYTTNPSDEQEQVEPFVDVGLNVDQKFGRLVKMWLYENFNYTEGATSRGDDADSYYENDVTLGLGVSFTPKLMLRGQGGHTFMRSETDNAARRRVTDRERLWGGLDLAQKLSRTIDLVGEVQGAHLDYEGDTDDDLDVDRGYTSIFAGLGVDKVQGKLKGSARVGWRSLDYDDGDLGADSAPSADIKVTAMPIKAVRVRADVSYMLRDSNVYPYSSQRRFGIGTGVEWDASKYLTLGVFGLYQHGDYDLDTVPERERTVGGREREDGPERRIVAGTDLTLRLGLRNAFTVAYQFEDVDSDVAASFTKSTARLMFARGF